MTTNIEILHTLAEAVNYLAVPIFGVISFIVHAKIAPVLARIKAIEDRLHKLEASHETHDDMTHSSHVKVSLLKQELDELKRIVCVLRQAKSE